MEKIANTPIEGKIVSIQGTVVELEFLNMAQPLLGQTVRLEKDSNIRIFITSSSNAKGCYYGILLSEGNVCARGDSVRGQGDQLSIKIGKSVLGRLLSPLAEPIDDMGPLADLEEVSIVNKEIKYEQVSSKMVLQETGIKIIDLFTPVLKGGKVGLFGGSGVGKTLLLNEILFNIINKDKKETVGVFCGVGERSREGHELYQSLISSDMLPHVALVFGTMGETAAKRFLTAHTSVTIAEYFRDVLNKDVLIFIDNIFRFTQAGGELALLMNNMPSEAGYQSTLGSEIAQIHERLSSRANNSITTIEAVYLPEDDLFDQAAQSVFSYLDSSIVLSRDTYREGRLPAVDILLSESSALNRGVVSDKHINCVINAKSLLKKAELLERIVSLVGESELSKEDRLVYQRARKLKNYMTQNFFTASAQTGRKGVYVPLESTISDVSAILDGKFDEVSEDKLLFVGTLDDISK